MASKLDRGGETFPWFDRIYKRREREREREGERERERPHVEVRSSHFLPLFLLLLFPPREGERRKETVENATKAKKQFFPPSSVGFIEEWKQ